MRRKLSLICACALIIAVAFSGCSSTGSKFSQKHSVVTLIVGSGSTPQWFSHFKQTIKDFEASHPNITVSYTQDSDPNSLEKQQLAAGVGPSIISADGPTSMQLFAGANYLKPLTEYVAKYKWDNIFASWVWKACEHQGTVMGLPSGMDLMVVYYNKDMFAKNGWTIPTNYNELVTLCKKISAQNLIPFAFGDSDFKTADEWWISEALNEAIGADNMKNLLTGKLSWQSPQVKAGFQKLVDMWQKGYIYKSSPSITMDDMNNLFVTGKAAMMMSGGWQTDSIESAKPGFDWGVFEMPSWTDGVTANLPVAIGGTYSISANCKDPDAAAEYLNYLYTPEVLASDIKAGDFEPTTNFDPGKVSGLDTHLTDLLNILGTAQKSNNIGYCAWTFWPPDVETYAWNNIESVYLGQQTLDNYLSQLQSNFDKDKAKNALFDFG